MKTLVPENAQSSDRAEYAGRDELMASERFLVKYNLDLVAKLSRGHERAADVLEFGAGVGTLAKLWHAATGIKPVCLEIDPEQRQIIEGRGFECYQDLGAVDRKFDVIYTSNVLEHIENDLQILRELSSRLKDGGSLIVYVPAFQVLYSELDEKIGHYRRYQKKDLLDKLKRSGFDVTQARYADSIGFFAWLYVKLKGYRAGNSEDGSMQFYDRYIFPLSTLLDELGLKHLFGKNILVYARKGAAAQAS